MRAHTCTVSHTYRCAAAVVMCFCLDGSTTSSYETIGASAFGNHGTLLGIIGTAEGIISE